MKFQRPILMVVLILSLCAGTPLASADEAAGLLEQMSVCEDDGNRNQFRDCLTILKSADRLLSLDQMAAGAKYEVLVSKRSVWTHLTGYFSTRKNNQFACRAAYAGLPARQQTLNFLDSLPNNPEREAIKRRELNGALDSDRIISLCDKMFGPLPALTVSDLDAIAVLSP